MSRHVFDLARALAILRPRYPACNGRISLCARVGGGIELTLNLWGPWQEQNPGWASLSRVGFGWNERARPLAVERWSCYFRRVALTEAYPRTSKSGLIWLAFLTGSPKKLG